ncbi:MAG: T9SS type A sorting domain-containing protein, partial [Bacteroidia bacterium]|nr:T9SS type A sorting domain-containing protein [Bacteroidia bacterium]
PEGIYFDAKTGNITATPITASQVTVLVIEVREWRKDSLGVYQTISVTRRDVQFAIVSTPNNNVPVITFDSIGSRTNGAGCVAFTVRDDVFVPPPPTTAYNDTLTVQLVGASSHLDMTIDSTVYTGSSTIVYGKVCYDSIWSTLGDNSIYLYARDNNCPWNAEASKGINLDFPNRSTASILRPNVKVLKGVKVYPNPATNSVTINMTNRVSDCRIELVDVTGKVLHAENHSKLKIATLDLRDIVSGAYIVRITSSEGVAYKNLIVK